MTKLRPSLGNSSDQEVLGTLQDVLDRLLTIERLSPGRRGDLRCAVNKMAKAIGQSAEEVPVNLGYLQQQLDGFVPAAYGMTAKRWSTIKADFQCCLAAHRLRRPPADVECHIVSCLVRGARLYSPPPPSNGPFAFCPLLLHARHRTRSRR